MDLGSKAWRFGGCDDGVLFRNKWYLEESCSYYWRWSVEFGGTLSGRCEWSIYGRRTGEDGGYLVLCNIRY